MSLNGKGNCYFDVNKLDEAIAFYDKVLEIKDDYYFANFNKANCLFTQNQYEKALESYDSAFQSLVEDEKDKWEYNLNNYEELLNKYENVIPVDENTSAIYNNLGMCLLSLGKHYLSEKCFDKAIRINKGDALLLINKARTLSDQGKYDESQRYVELTLDALKVPSVSLTKNAFVYVIKQIEELNTIAEQNKKEEEEEDEKEENSESSIISDIKDSEVEKEIFENVKDKDKEKEKEKGK